MAGYYNWGNKYYVDSEVNSGFFYKSAAEREKLVQAERAFTDSKVQKIIDLKKQVCDSAEKGDGKKKGFIVVNMKVWSHFMFSSFYAYLSPVDLSYSL